MVLRQIVTKHPESHSNHYEDNDQNYFHHQMNLINTNNRSCYNTDKNVEKYLIQKRDITIIHILFCVIFQTSQKQKRKYESKGSERLVPSNSSESLAHNRCEYPQGEKRAQKRAYILYHAWYISTATKQVPIMGGADTIKTHQKQQQRVCTSIYIVRTTNLTLEREKELLQDIHNADYKSFYERANFFNQTKNSYNRYT